MKKKRLVLAVLIIGIMTAIGLFLHENLNRELDGGNRIVRNDEGFGDSEISVDAQIENLKNPERIILSIPERELTEKEVTDLFLRLKDELPERTKGENRDLRQVSADLFFPEKVDGYPFKIRWKSSDEDLIDNRGHISYPEDGQEKHEILVIATAVYKDFSKNIEIPVYVIPKDFSFEEEIRQKLRTEAQNATNEYPQNEVIILPDKVDEMKITWKRGYSYTGVIVLAATLFLAILIGIASDYDENRKKKEKEERLRKVYPIFVEKLRMYLVSGLSMRKSFFQLKENFERNGRKEYEELITALKSAVNELENGIGEEKVYDEFGTTCAGEYRKLAFLIIVNLKQGNNRMMELLQEENRKAMAAYKEKILEMSDKAGIKLLFPMMIMLIVVMVMIMCPAYLEIR